MPLDPELDPHFDEAARLNNLDPTLLRALALGESNGDPRAVSSKGALGLMQFMPDTAKGLGIDPSDPVQAIYGAAQHLNDRLTYHEGQKEQNPNIVPVDEALKDYFAGESGRGRGVDTAGYPGKIASRYRQVAGGGEPPPTGIDALAQARSATTPPPGQVAANFRPPAGTPDMLDAAPPGVAALAALAGQGTAPTGAIKRDAGGAYREPTDYGSNAANLILGATGTAVTPLSGEAKVAQAGPSDAELLKAFNEAFPTGGQGAVSANGPTPPPATSAGMGQNNITAPDIRWAQQQSQAYAVLGKPVPDYIKTMSEMEPGMPLSPQYQQQAEAAKKLGGNLQTVVPGPNGPQIANLPGAVGAEAEKEGAVAEAKQVPLRTSEAVKPREQRGAGSSTTFPPGSPGAQQWIDARAAGKQTPAGVRINDDGSVEVGNVNVPPEVVHQRYTELGKLADEANQARLGQYEAQNLQQKLHAIGTSGPLTEQLGQLSALAKQLGVPDETINKLNIPKAATVEEAKKLSTDLLGSILHQTFPQRITNTDITAWKGTVPQATSMLEANDFLIDKIILPKFQRSIDRYGHASSLSENDPQLTSYYKAMNDWDNAHPFDAYAIAKDFKPGASPAPAGASTRPLKEWTIKDGKLVPASP
jgi:hypothetical protein